MTELDALWWPLARLGEGLEALALASGVSAGAAQPLLAPPIDAPNPQAEARRWVDWAGDQLGVEVLPVDTAVPELPQLLRDAGPTVLPYEDERGIGFFLLLGQRWGRPVLMGPLGQRRRVGVHRLRDALCQHREAPLEAEVQALLDAADVPSARRPRVRAVLMQQRLACERIGPCWMLRLPASTSLWQQLAQARLPRRLGVALGLFALLYALEITGWGLLGNAALNGRLDLGWMAAWVLLLLSTVPLRLAGGWLQSTFALDVGRILKSRLFAGALRLDLDQVRRLGVGQWLGRVIESQALESLALSGGLAVAVASIELAAAAWVLSQGAAPAWHGALLLAWLCVTVALAWRYARRLQAWTLERLDLTHELVEGMVGHRTRLAQERAGRRDAQEDQRLQAYLKASAAMDRAAVPAFVGVPSGWMVLALAALAPALVVGTATNATAWAISLGGLLLAQRAFGGITGGVAGLARAVVAWRQVRGLFQAGQGGAVPGQPFVPARHWAQGASSGVLAATTGAHGATNGSKAPLVDATGLAYAYPQAGGQPGERVLQACDLRIASGERLLLEGPSGGGKSTLAALLTGLRQPQAGLLLLAGLDRHTLGQDWHRLATAAPQFHENHVFSGTLAFNLLMGREGPASALDLYEARQLCQELGLDELLQRMPAGLHQRVGETGWQLSHGERSRIFLARALLQGAPLTIMDESFAALDPETLERCLRTVLRRAGTLIVIAHP